MQYNLEKQYYSIILHFKGTNAETAYMLGKYCGLRINECYGLNLNGEKISSLELVNSLPNGKIQTVNSMKYHSRTLQGEHNILFKYHYLRHTYRTNLTALNTPEYLLCNQIGHSNSQVTHKYYVAISEKGIDELLKNLEKM